MTGIDADFLFRQVHQVDGDALLDGRDAVFIIHALLQHERNGVGGALFRVEQDERIMVHKDGISFRFHGEVTVEDVHRRLRADGDAGGIDAGDDRVAFDKDDHTGRVRGIFGAQPRQRVLGIRFTGQCDQLGAVQRDRVMREVIQLVDRAPPSNTSSSNNTDHSARLFTGRA